jgi:hypothetical protein
MGPNGATGLAIGHAHMLTRFGQFATGEETGI